MWLIWLKCIKTLFNITQLKNLASLGVKRLEVDKNVVQIYFEEVNRRNI